MAKVVVSQSTSVTFLLFQEKKHQLGLKTGLVACHSIRLEGERILSERPVDPQGYFRAVSEAGGD